MTDDIYDTPSKEIVESYENEIADLKKRIQILEERVIYWMKVASRLVED